MKKNTILNMIMVVTILAIIIGGVFIVGNNKGWFNKDAYANNATLGDTIGAVNVLRGGIAYSLDSDSFLKDGDVIETGKSSSVSIVSGDNTFVISENTEISIDSAANDAMSLGLVRGELFAVVNNHDNIGHFILDENDVNVNQSVFSASVHEGSFSAYILSGEVVIDGRRAKAGESIEFVGKQGEVVDLDINNLNGFAIDNAQKTSETEQLCFSAEELQILVDARLSEMGRIEGSPVEVPEEKDSGVSSDNTCTVQILCDTILENMDKLTPGKDIYVPQTGIILTANVKFSEGETAFDVLRRACEYTNTQIEYSWTPIYDSYYIEGINNLYEFDCGGESGWTYKVNGWSPNYGASGYEVEDGDVILWQYTCRLGNDVGRGIN